MYRTAEYALWCIIRHAHLARACATPNNVSKLCCVGGGVVVVGGGFVVQKDTQTQQPQLKQRTTRIRIGQHKFSSIYCALLKTPAGWMAGPLCIKSEIMSSRLYNSLLLRSLSYIVHKRVRIKHYMYSVCCGSFCLGTLVSCRRRWRCRLVVPRVVLCGNFSSRT